MATLAQMIQSHTNDYKQLLDGYPNASRFIGRIKDNVSKNIPSNEDLKSTKRMIEWSQAVALNSPMMASMKTPTNEFITSIIENAEKKGFSDFGIRAVTRHPKAKLLYKEGDALPYSHVWNDGISTNEKLPGVSTIRIDYDGFDVENIEKTIEKLKPYTGDGEQVVLVGGHNSFEGNDAGERVIGGAPEVLHVFSDN